MFKVQNSEVKNYIEVNGVVLSEQAINELKFLQSGNIGGYRNDIADTVSELVVLLDYHVNEPEHQQRIVKLIRELSDLRRSLSVLEKP